MAKLTKQGDNRIFIANKSQNRSLTVQAFADTLESENGGDFQAVDTAEQKADIYLRNNPGASVIDGAKSIDEALEKARDNFFD